MEAAPELIVELVAVDVDRGWMLMRDAGSRLRELVAGAEQIKHWLTILPWYAELSAVPSLLAYNGSSRSASRTHASGNLPTTSSAHLATTTPCSSGGPMASPSMSSGACAARCRWWRRCARESPRWGIPETIQHDDFHDGQIFVRGGRYRFLDWGDSCISHPFHTMVVTLRALAWQQGLPPGGVELLRMRDAYLAPFEELASPAELRAAFDLAHRTGTIGRALAWHRYFVGDRAPSATTPSPTG